MAALGGRHWHEEHIGTAMHLFDTQRSAQVQRTVSWRATQAVAGLREADSRPGAVPVGLARLIPPVLFGRLKP